MMSTPWTRRFEKACRKWQTKLGLTDWSIAFSVGKTHPDNVADVAYDGPSRHATVTSYTAPTNANPERVALHEMLHLLFADMLRAAAQRGEFHQDVVLEEHRAIERLTKILEAK